jgi:hypothetical protein
VEKLQIGRQQRDEPPRDPERALHRPSEDTAAGAGRIRRRGSDAAATGAARRRIVEADRERAQNAVARGTMRKRDPGGERR